MTSPRPASEPGRMLTVGRFRGVPICVAPSWVLIGALLTSLYGPTVADAVPGVRPTTAYLVAFGFSVLFGLCVLAHELGHTAVSLGLGLRVRRVVLFLLGGVSEIESEPQRARDELLIAAAGPLVSIILGGFAYLGYLACDPASLPGVLLGLLSWSNLVLAAFNLLPGLPLDGGRIVRAAVWGLGGAPLTGTRVASWAGKVVAVLVALSGLVADRTTWGFTGALFSIGLAAYLWFGATNSLRLAELRAKLPGVTLHELLRPGLFVPGTLSVAEALRRAWDGNARGLVLLDAADEPSAIVDESLIKAVSPEQRPWTQVNEVARSLEPGLMLPVGLSGPDLLEAMRATPAHEYLVVHPDGSAAGILAAADLATQLNPNQAVG